jgi:hypothetical protein
MKEGEPRQGSFKTYNTPHSPHRLKHRGYGPLSSARIVFDFRKRELLGLRVRAGNRSDRWIHLSGEDTKNGKPRKVKK